MTEEANPNNNQPDGDGLLNAFLTFTRILARFILIVLLLGFLALLVFGVPYVYWRFVTPVVHEFNYLASAQVEQLQTNQSLIDDLNSIQQRADKIELRIDSEKQSFGELEQSILEISDSQQSQMDEFAATQEVMDNLLVALNAEISTIDTRISGLSSELEQFSSNLTTVEENQQDLENRLFSQGEPINQLRRDILVLKAMGFLTRSQLLIYQNNFGLAEQHLQSAHTLLSEILVPEEQQDAMADVIERLDLALENLPGEPDLAAQDLEIAWKLLDTNLFSDAASVISLPATAITTPNESTPSPGVTGTSTPSAVP